VFNEMKKSKATCRSFQEEMEGLPAGEGTATKPGETLERMSPASREHGRECTKCEAALGDLLETRKALGAMAEPAPKVDAWFVTRVMAAISARERELELRNNVWISVLRLAPRMVALCMVVLMVGTTWAYQLRRAERAQREVMPTTETVFESGQASPLNDDVMLSPKEARP
jgi:hypothetical protein